MLEIKKLNKDFGKKRILHDINLSLKKGEVLSILGESGSGKSTLLRIIAGLESATEYEQFKCNAKTAMMFQNYALFPHLNVQENILFALHHYPKAKKEQRCKELLKLFEIDEIKEREIDEISGGQAQRVAFARAVATDCELLLLDEPFSNLDRHLKTSLRKDLKELIASQNLSAIIVTHDIDDAFALSNYIALLQKGKIIDFNTPKGLYLSPSSPSSQAFLPYLNLIHEELIEEDEFFEWIKSKNYTFSASEIQTGTRYEAEVLDQCFLGGFVLLTLKYKHIVFEMIIPPHHKVQRYIKFDIAPLS